MYYTGVTFYKNLETIVNMHIVVRNKQNTVTPFSYFPPMRPTCVTLLQHPKRKLLPVPMCMLMCAFGSMQFYNCVYCVTAVNHSLHSSIRRTSHGNSLPIQWLGPHDLTWEGPASIPGQGTKIPQVKHSSGQKKKKKSLVLPFYSQSHLSSPLPLEAPGNH